MIPVEERIAQLDEQIYVIYQRAHAESEGRRMIRLDPTSGQLGLLWLEWDYLHEGLVA